MTSKKQLESKVESLEKKGPRESMREGKSNAAEALEELQEEIDEVNLSLGNEELEGLSISKVEDYLEYREKHLEDEEADDSAEEKTFEEIIEELEDELEKAQKLEGMHEELEDTDRFSVEALRERANEEGIGNNFVVEWLDREGLLVEEFRKEM